MKRAVQVAIFLAFSLLPAFARVWPISPGRIDGATVTFVYEFAYDGTSAGTATGYVQTAYATTENGTFLVAVVDTLWKGDWESSCAVAFSGADGTQLLPLPATASGGELGSASMTIVATETAISHFVFFFISKRNCSEPVSMSSYQCTFTQIDGSHLSEEEFFCFQGAIFCAVAFSLLLFIHVFLHAWYLKTCVSRGSTTGSQSSLPVDWTVSNRDNRTSTSEAAASPTTSSVSLGTADVVRPAPTKRFYAWCIGIMIVFLVLSSASFATYLGIVSASGKDVPKLLLADYVFKGIAQFLLYLIAFLFAMGYLFIDHKETRFFYCCKRELWSRMVKLMCNDDDNIMIWFALFVLVMVGNVVAYSFCFVQYFRNEETTIDPFLSSDLYTPQAISFMSLSLISLILFLFWSIQRCWIRNRPNRPYYYPVNLIWSLGLQFMIPLTHYAIESSPFANGTDFLRAQAFFQNGFLLGTLAFIIYSFLPMRLKWERRTTLVYTGTPRTVEINNPTGNIVTMTTEGGFKTERSFRDLVPATSLRRALT